MKIVIEIEGTTPGSATIRCKIGNLIKCIENNFDRLRNMQPGERLRIMNNAGVSLGHMTVDASSDESDDDE